ncbi:hypothetical protein IFM89_039781 [Coptis chinensis]|uniref:Uncharacterized protein n=1 Tax=Coptis chinensis TaxID=261450 RepID=A0A835LC27_9MAGN|nr:hypothetical protein IFM89_039781 [Coptis chinensis]
MHLSKTPEPCFNGFGSEVYFKPMSESQHAQPPLYKQHSLSSDMYRDEAWLRRRQNSKNRISKSVTDDDLDELKTCMELGFGFDSPDLDRKLSDTFPTLEFYFAINTQYNNSVSKIPSPCRFYLVGS